MLRQSHRAVSGARSTGAAEHHRVTGLSRAGVLVVAVAVALACFPASAGAQSTEERIAETRAAIDETAQAWFAHTQEAAALQDEITALEQRVADDQGHAARVAEIARGRAVEIYKGSSGNLAGVLEASDALDGARRAELLDRANADGQEAIDELGAVAAELSDKRAELEDRRTEQEHLVADLAAQQQALEEQLAGLADQARQEAEAARLAADQAAKRQAAAATKTRSNKPSAPARAPAPAAPAAPAAERGSGSHRDEPFLVCTRARESGGSYGAVNPAGYYGAYQFAPTTWDITASHAGRLDLIGVLPSHAAPADQDELAWSLYGWRGNQPWGGRC